MSTYPDQHGLELTCQSAEAARLFDETVSGYLGFKKDTGHKLKLLISEDPDMPMAVCLRGYLTMLVGNKIANDKANALIVSLNRLVDQTGLSEREIKHCRALGAWVEGQLDEALEQWESILSNHPTDSLALRLSHHFHFYSGDGKRMKISLSRVLPYWDESLPHYGFVLGMHAFGLEEAGEFSDAEKFGRRAVELNPEDAWSAHAVAHVFEMNERHEEGIRWVESLASNWRDVNNFRFHIHWHRSLFHLERLEFDEALNLYDTEIASDLSADFSLDMCNAASLLYRFELYGVDVGDRWIELAETAQNHIRDKDMVFTSIHYLMALIAAKNKSHVDQLLSNLEHWSKEETTQGRICANVGIGLANSLVNLRSGQEIQAVEMLIKLRDELFKIGGSIAQRDLFQLILLSAACQKKSAEFALALFSDRVKQRPKSLWTLENYRNLLEENGYQRKKADVQRMIENLHGQIRH